MLHKNKMSAIIAGNAAISDKVVRSLIHQLQTTTNQVGEKLNARVKRTYLAPSLG